MRQAGVFRMDVEPEGATEKVSTLVEQALPVFQAAGDDMALYVAYSALGDVAGMRGQMGAELEAYERAFTHARSAGLPPGRVLFVSRRAPLPRGDFRCRNCSPGSTRTSPEQDRITSSVPGALVRWRCSVASTRRARSSPKRVRTWRNAAWGPCSPPSLASCPSGSRSAPTIPPPQPSTQQQGSGCSRKWGPEPHVDRGRQPGTGALRT